MRRIVQVLLVSSCVICAGSIVQAKDLGGKRGINADVSVSVGGNDGINADVGANIGGQKNGINADVDVSLGGNDGVNATIGREPGADVDIGLGPGTDDDSNPSNPDNANTSSNGINPGSDKALTSSQRQAFNSLSDKEKKALITRCGSVNSGNSDAALVSLCKLLRMSASR